MLSQGRRFIRGGAEGVFQLLNSRHQQLAVDGPVEIRNQSAFEESVKPEPEPRKRTLTVSKFTEGLGLIDAGVEMLEDVEWYEKRAAATREGIVRMLV